MADVAEEPDETSFFRDVGVSQPRPISSELQREPATPLLSRTPRSRAINGNESTSSGSSPDTASQNADAKAAPLYLGHRERVRKRFDKVGGETFEDYELLEIALFGVIPRGDTKDIAKRLLKRFGTFAEVVGAPKHLLQEVDGVGKNAATDIKVLASVAQRLTKGAVIRREALSSWDLILDYLRASMAFDAIEKFRVLYLNKKNLLIADEVQQEGIVDHTPAYPSKVVNRAYNLGATAIVLVHNHPSGDPEPSRADIDMTKAIITAAKAHGIVVHDHIIIGRDGHASLRGLGYI